MLINPRNPAEGQQRDEAAQASAIGQQILVLHASNDREIDAAFEGLNRQRAGALIVGADAFFTGRRDQITALAAHYGIPAIYPWREYVQAGGLMSYGISLAESYRQMGVYVGRILRGVKPAELPVMRPTRIELILISKPRRQWGLRFRRRCWRLPTR